MVKLRKGASSVVAILLTLALVLAACSSGGSNSGSQSSATPTPTPANSESPSATSAPEEPEKIVKVRVTKWDRGNQPAGAPDMKDNPVVKYINEQLRPLGVEVEYVQIPRAEESTKLTTWLASGDAPDILIVYDPATFYRYAAQGGLKPLDDLLDQYGENIKINNKNALEQAGVLNGVRYGIPAIRSAVGGANMSIRKDWLDKLGMEIPTTIEELTEVLRAFRDQDPGGVGKENVIPWGLPSLAGGQAAFFYGPMYAFGVDNQGVAPTGIYLPSGNIVNGEFVSGFATEEGKAFFKWMNQMYHEGILPKEFATDVNSQNFKQEFANGHIGFIDANDPAYSQNINVRKTYPDATYAQVHPLKRPDGTQMFGQNWEFGMFIFIPKTTSDEVAAAAIKYLN